MLQTVHGATIERRRGRIIHRGKRVLPPVPPQWGTARTALNIAAQTLFQWPAETYPGIERGMVATLGARSTANTIRKWRQGARRTPAWVAAAVLEELERRRRAIEHAEALLRAELEKRNAKP